MSFFGPPSGTLACATIPDKQSTGLFGAKAQICKQIFSLIRAPFRLKKDIANAMSFFGPPSGTRTQDPLIKSQLLYHLS